MLCTLVCLLVGVLPNQDSESDADVQAVASAALAKLPGHSGFAFTELSDKGPRLLYGVRQDERFAVGSSFKLFILATLADEVNGDRRALDNVMRLRADWIGPPHSELAEWPLDSPVTLQTLALKMISISDNTATDHLLHLLGRERIERQIETLVPQHADWNRPLLSTREMTQLRDAKTGMLGHEYQKLDEAGRRKFLVDHFSGKPDYEPMDFDAAAFELAEWYATPLDMADTLSWIKSHTEEGQPANPLRGVMAMETKLPHDPGQWPYVGFKGGSEDDLLAGNWLLKNKNGNWYTLHVYWNNTAGKADPEKMIDAITTIFAAVSKTLQ